MTTAETSYLDYESILDPDFSSVSFANSLILTTNDATDTHLDLATPLSRVLFDVQEVDIHIDNLTTKSAVPLLEYTEKRSDASAHILDEVSSQLESLNEGYRRLEKDVIDRYEKAEQVRLAADRLCQALRLGRVVSRCLNLGRQLETQMEDLGVTPSTTTTPSSGQSARLRENHRSMVAASRTVLELRSILSNPTATDGLDRVTIVNTLKTSLVAPLERSLTSLAQQSIREFSVASLPAASTAQAGASSTTVTTTFAHSEAAKSRTTSALTSLYLLSPCPLGTREDLFEPRLLLNSLTAYLQANLTSSQASLARALATLPTLERTLAEVGGRCSNVVALEQVLATTRRGVHPYLTSSAGGGAATTTTTTTTTNGKANGHTSARSGPDSDSGSDTTSESDGDGDNDHTSHTDPNTTAAAAAAAAATATVATTQQPGRDLRTASSPLLPLLLHALDSPSLASYFWRTLAGGMTSRVMEILGRGGVSARTLKSNRERVAGLVRECVIRSSSTSSSSSSLRDGGGTAAAAAGGEKGDSDGGGGGGGFEREAAVMVGSIVGVLNR